jgi:hypothetical protein
MQRIADPGRELEETPVVVRGHFRENPRSLIKSRLWCAKYV